MAAFNARFNLKELMICAAAHQLEDNKIAVIGVGMPLAAAMLAQRTLAPNLVIMFEAGSSAPVLEKLPLSVGGSYTMTHAIMHSSMFEIMDAAQRGIVDYTFLGGAQIDMYGNINSTMIGEDYLHPKVRLPGSGGANDLGSLCWRTIYVMRKQSLRTFVKKLDFLTTPGYLTGPGAREAAGLPAGSGPYRVITQLGVYGFEETSKRMQLLAVHPGVAVEQVQAESEFEILLAPEVGTSLPPTAVEQALLHEIDPMGMAVGR